MVSIINGYKPTTNIVVYKTKKKESTISISINPIQIFPFNKKKQQSPHYKARKIKFEFVRKKRYFFKKKKNAKETKT